MSGRTPSSPMVATASLVRLALRRDRVRLPAWLIGTGVLSAYFAAALPIVYSEPGDLSAIGTFMQSPAGRLLSGPGFGWDDPTFASAFADVYVPYLHVLAGVLAVLLVTRHTRAEEESARLELVLSASVGRLAPVASAVVVLAMAALGLLLLGALAAVTAGYPVAGSVLFGATLATTASVFGGITLVAAQCLGSARSTAAAGCLAVGVAFVVRGVADVSTSFGWISWLSPLGWAQQTRLFVDDRPWPLLLGAGTTVVLVATGVVLQARRDLGGALLPARPGPVRAGRGLIGPLGLALRLERGSIATWMVAVGALGALFGGLTESATGALGSSGNEVLLRALGGDPDRLADGFLTTSLQTIAYLVLAFAVVTVQRLRAEEVSGRLELVLSAAVGRARWPAGVAATSLTGAFLLLVSAGAGLGLGAAATTGQGRHVPEVLLGALAYLPAVAVVVAVALVGYGLGPSWLGVAWVVAGGNILVGFLGIVVDLPRALTAAFPLEHVAKAPSESLEVAPLATLAVVAVVLGAAGLTLLRRRDLR